MYAVARSHTKIHTILEIMEEALNTNPRLLHKDVKGEIQKREECVE